MWSRSYYRATILIWNVVVCLYIGLTLTIFFLLLRKKVHLEGIFIALNGFFLNADKAVIALSLSYVIIVI